MNPATRAGADLWGECRDELTVAARDSGDPEAFWVGVLGGLSGTIAGTIGHDRTIAVLMMAIQVTQLHAATLGQQRMAS